MSIVPRENLRSMPSITSIGATGTCVEPIISPKLAILLYAEKMKKPPRRILAREEIFESYALRAIINQ